MSGKYKNISEKDGVKAVSWEFNNIQMGHAVSSFNEYTVSSASNDNEMVRLHFGLKGDYGFTYRQLGQSFDLAGGHHNIMYSNGIDLEIRNKTLEIETFGINFPKEVFIQFIEDGDDMLKRFAEDINQGKSCILSNTWGTVDIKIQKVIDTILSSPYTGKLQDVFLLSKSLELLVLCVDNYKSVNSYRPKHVRNQVDKEKLMAARDFINDRLSSPPNLSEISQKIGMNEFKLKNGFKELFQSTIFGYLTERRLNMARQYLLDTNKTAAEIAYELGYSSPQHFNQQFRNKFGVTPNSIRNYPSDIIA
ncbi:MAG: AraC family transcriptional regulator [Bacteroidota bacterium]